MSAFSLLNSAMTFVRWLISSCGVAAPRLPKVTKKFSTLALATRRRPPSAAETAAVSGRGLGALENVTGDAGWMRYSPKRSSRIPVRGRGVAPFGLTSAPTRKVFVELNPGGGYGASPPPFKFALDELLPSSKATMLRLIRFYAALQTPVLPTLCVG